MMKSHPLPSSHRHYAMLFLPGQMDFFELSALVSWAKEHFLLVFCSVWLIKRLFAKARRKLAHV